MENANFLVNLESALGEAYEKKNQEPKNEQTRYWAVVYTELEKVLAYYKTYLS